MKRVLPYLVTLLMSLLACVGYSTQVAAEQAPVEDQSTNSPNATSQPGETAGDSRETYSSDLRVPYGTGGGVRSSNSGFPRDDAIEQPVYEPVEAGDSGSRVSGGASGNAQLFYKVQILEQEVRELRGMLEEQAHKLDRLAREQKDQYLDIDRRLSQSSRNVPAASGSDSPGTAAVPSGSTISPEVAEPGPSAADVNAVVGADPESREYNLAFALTREKRYQEAINGFTSLVDDYPNGAYTGNAFYWLGELYLALDAPDIEKSRQSFVQVVNLFPDHAKVPDSLYKLGVVYHRLGDLVRARQYLNQVTSQYPASASARLASSYLADLP